MDEVTGVFVAFLIAVVPLALLVTKGVDFVRNLFDSSGRAPKWVWNVVAFGLGILLAMGWEYNLVTTLAHAIPALADNTALDGFWGQVLTGMAIGATAGFWHEKLDQWSSAAKANRAVAVANTTVAVSE